jgi:hypothetical protein
VAGEDFTGRRKLAAHSLIAPVSLLSVLVSSNSVSGEKYHGMKKLRTFTQSHSFQKISKLCSASLKTLSIPQVDLLIERKLFELIRTHNFGELKQCCDNNFQFNSLLLLSFTNLRYVPAILILEPSSYKPRDSSRDFTLLNQIRL